MMCKVTAGRTCGEDVAAFPVIPIRFSRWNDLPSGKRRVAPPGARHLPDREGRRLGMNYEKDIHESGDGVALRGSGRHGDSRGGGEEACAARMDALAASPGEPGPPEGLRRLELPSEYP